MKPSLAKGTRDFSAAEVQKRQYIMNVLREQFELRGYDPIETPSFENIETLTGKYGEEGDRLIFKILRSGDFTSKIDEGMWASKNPKTLTSKVADKALRYDLTVPFARYVVQHQNELAFPFKRYQMQPVWRADRPQKGRFREFYQCDADVVGSDSLWQEVELIQLYDASFTRLGLSTTIKLNNRKILAGMAEVLGISTDFIAFTVAIDKLDKVGPEGVLKEMRTQALPESAVIRFGEWLEEGLTLERLTGLLAESSEGKLGLEEMNFVMSQATAGLTSSELVFDFTLARGLNYYTGTIIEVCSKTNDRLGSIGGGGRYDDLTSLFNLKNISGVGISFGLDRIYLLMDESNMFPAHLDKSFEFMVANFGIENLKKISPYIDKLRNLNNEIFLYPDHVKLNKQFTYANKHNASFVIIYGDNERKKDVVTLKNMQTGDQSTHELSKFVSIIKKL